MQLVIGNVKVQHGIYRIYEVLEIPNPQESEPDPPPVAGYAIFNLNDQRLSKIFGSFERAIAEINRLTKI